MKETGGAFEKAIAEAWLKADDANRSKLTTMFPEFEKFSAENWNLAAQTKLAMQDLRPGETCFDNIFYYPAKDIKKCQSLLLKGVKNLPRPLVEPQNAAVTYALNMVEELIHKTFGVWK